MCVAMAVAVAVVAIRGSTCTYNVCEVVVGGGGGGDGGGVIE